jgi:hypothetical protein
MIIYKQWKESHGLELYFWDGWFLFGIIPIYIRSRSIR